VNKKKSFYIVPICFVVVIGLLVFLSSGKSEVAGSIIQTHGIKPLYQKTIKQVEKEEKFNIDVIGDSTYLFYSNGYGYRYGPSIMKYEDGSIDVWLSAPGNSGSHWDYITYRHSDDGINWTDERVVLRPTPGSKDQCSVCDPGLIYFGGYYYLGYTATAYYAGNGTNNSAFVARSENPDGPFEKWNGEGWGGYPKPIIEYEGSPSGWGIGEISFVVKDNELYVYYTYFDELGGSTRLAKSDLAEDWPARLEGDETVCFRNHQDSMDVVYVDDIQTFLGFSVFQRMTQNSRLIIYESKDGLEFKEVDKAKGTMEDYAHNVGISKDEKGHTNMLEDNYIGYGFGARWGKWSAVLKQITIKRYFE